MSGWLFIFKILFSGRQASSLKTTSLIQIMRKEKHRIKTKLKSVGKKTDAYSKNEAGLQED